MKFAHLGDCHLGGWRQPELKSLNMQSFKEALRQCKNEKVNFILITGDLFDSAYPPIETLKETFEEFRKLKESNIPVFLIAGSHDYSVSGKTFLDVLEKSGFAKNVVDFEEKNGHLQLQPTVHGNVAIYGYPGKKSGMEVEEINRIKLQDAPGMFKILMLHTTIRDAVGIAPVNSVDERNLPKVDYLALSHLHINYNKEGRVYSGPLFPNNLSELEELRGGSFYIFDNGSIQQRTIQLRDVLAVHLEITDALKATEDIMSMLENEDVSDKIVLVRLSGILEKGKIPDIDFKKIESFLQERGAFVFLKSTSKLHMDEPEVEFHTTDSDQIEREIIQKFKEKNPSRFNPLISDLIRALEVEKMEDETISTFEDRIFSETTKLLENEIQKNQD